jgi:integrase/recombinase XerD
MKTCRNGQAAVLSTDQLDRLIAALPARHHQVLAEVCRRTACRISEARQLTWNCITNSAVVLPRSVVKGKLASREIPMTPMLQGVIADWRYEWAAQQGREPHPNDWIFPGRYKGACLSSRGFMDALRVAADTTGLMGVSSHSFRRSALSAASSAGVPLAVIQTISGHRSLAVLQRYLAVTDAEKAEAAAAFA